MKKAFHFMTLLVSATLFSPLVASAQSTYTTANGTVNLVAGLTNLTSATAINPTNQSVGVQFITDGSWSTGVAQLGGAVGAIPNNGTLAGTFGGGTYFGSTNGITLIGIGTAWGSWTIRLLLSNDTYSSPISFTSSDLIENSSVLTAADAQFLWNDDGTTLSLPDFPTYYQELNIGAFDSGNIGFKGIELSAMTNTFPDISYIGVTGPAAAAVPEPGQVAASLLLLSGIGGYVFLKRRKAAKATVASV